MTEETPDYCYIAWPESFEPDAAIQYVAQGKERDAFHLGQQYTGINARQISCKICGCDRFHVGQDDYLTVIRCVDCHEMGFSWELVIHEG